MTNYFSKGENYKATIFYEDEEPFLRIEYDTKDNEGRLLHATIHKIGLKDFGIDRNCDCRNNTKAKLQLSLFTSKYNDLVTLVDVTPYKEMSLKEIEKALGYKIKIVD